jgi:dihydrofolate reductase
VAAAPEVFVIGGEQIYQATLPHADRLLLTEIDHDYAGDAHFPDWDRRAFVETSREVHPAASPQALDFAFVTYERRPASA